GRGRGARRALLPDGGAPGRVRAHPAIPRRPGRSTPPGRASEGPRPGPHRPPAGPGGSPTRALSGRGRISGRSARSGEPVLLDRVLLLLELLHLAGAGQREAVD